MTHGLPQPKPNSKNYILSNNKIYHSKSAIQITLTKYTTGFSHTISKSAVSTLSILQTYTLTLQKRQFTQNISKQLMVPLARNSNIPSFQLWLPV